MEEGGNVASEIKSQVNFLLSIIVYQACVSGTSAEVKLFDFLTDS
jgi:hypothetical protein